jgi:hypothetical protein
MNENDAARPRDKDKDKWSDRERDISSDTAARASARVPRGHGDVTEEFRLRIEGVRRLVSAPLGDDSCRVLSRVVAIAMTVVVGVACGSSSDVTSGRPSGTSSHAPSNSPSGASTAGAGTQLPAGKSVLAVDPGDVRSPRGFHPEVTLHLERAWTSTHRGADGFDLGHPDPERDAPGLAVVVLLPPTRARSATVRAIVAAAQAAGATVHTGRGAVGATPADAVDIRGGTGEIVASRAQTIALDATRGGRLKVLVVDVAGSTVVAVVLVPRARHWEHWWPQARALLATLRPAVP